jgi:hypothetical protein
MVHQPAGGRPGIPVDAGGGPTVDPTKNVLDLVDAAVKRQDDLRRTIDQRLDAEHVPLKEYITGLLAAYDKRYEQRYEASQKALEAALIAQKEAVREAFSAQKEAINAALASAERAVLKAEAAAEKRFEGLNEFRNTLSDQQRTLIPRAEVDVIIRGVLNQLGSVEKTLDASIAERQAQIASLQKALDAFLSERRGVAGGWGFAAGAVGLVLAILGLASRFWGP